MIVTVELRIPEEEENDDLSVEEIAEMIEGWTGFDVIKIGGKQ